jgi:FAD synthetase
LLGLGVFLLSSSRIFCYDEKAMKKVLATGVFDILHPGHLYYLRQSKKQGDYLMVLVASDQSAEKRGKQVVFNQRERIQLVSSLKVVDRVMAGQMKVSEGETVKKFKPDVIALGFDQKIDEKKLRASLRQAFGWQGKIIRIAEMPHGKISSSRIKRQIKRGDA